MRSRIVKGKIYEGRSLPALFFLSSRRIVRHYRDDVVISYAAKLAASGAFGMVYLVGGSVRDMLFGRLPFKDYDFAAEKNVSGFMRKMSDELKSGFFVMDEETQTYRMAGNRGKKKFVIDATLLRGSIEEDLRLRDFTINAMAVDLSAYDSKDGRGLPVIDPYGGASDYRRRILRPLTSSVFRDDPIRLLRAFRLSQAFGLKTERTLLRLIRKERELLRNSSVERVRDELLLIFSFPGAADTIGRMYDCGVFSEVFSELS